MEHNPQTPQNSHLIRIEGQVEHPESVSGKRSRGESLDNQGIKLKLKSHHSNRYLNVNGTTHRFISSDDQGIFKIKEFKECHQNMEC